jgi:hypothetical protein
MARTVSTLTLIYGPVVVALTHKFAQRLRAIRKRSNLHALRRKVRAAAGWRIMREASS